MMDISARSLKAKRTFITKLLDAGLYPYTKQYLGTFGNHFSTIGLVGMNEAGLNAKWLQKDLSAPEVQKFAKDVLNHMREKLSDYQELYGDLYNLEATPESTARFVNNTRLSLQTKTELLITRTQLIYQLIIQMIFLRLLKFKTNFKLYTSGTVFHAFLGEKLSDWRAAARLIRKIAENYKLPYYTISPSICKNRIFNGEVDLPGLW